MVLSQIVVGYPGRYQNLKDEHFDTLALFLTFSIQSEKADIENILSAGVQLHSAQDDLLARSL